MLEYKADWYGRDLVVVDRWFPSSKLCSACGHPGRQDAAECPGLDVPGCGAVHDRDVNAAEEHPRRRAGGEVKRLWSRCKTSTRVLSGGRPAVKQETHGRPWESPSFTRGRMSRVNLSNRAAAPSTALATSSFRG